MTNSSELYPIDKQKKVYIMYTPVCPYLPEDGKTDFSKIVELWAFKWTKDNSFTLRHK